MDAKGTSAIYRFLILFVLSIALMIVDHGSQLLKPLRLAASIINVPFQAIVSVPSAVTDMADHYYPDDSLFEEYERLKQKQFVIESKLQRFEALEEENARLSELLLASRQSDEAVLLGKVVDVGIDPYSHRVVINRGIEVGIYSGQPAITPLGVVGQVTEPGLYHSVVTLITDPSHGTPVQVQRNGLRTIVMGEGKNSEVSVPFLSANSDIIKGDVLVTSGIGGRYPVGYKVAVVREIVKDANEAFLRVYADTAANVGFAKEVLLLWSSGDAQTPVYPHLNSADGQ